MSLRIPYESTVVSSLSHFLSLVSTNKRQLRQQNTTNLRVIKSGRDEAMIYTVLVSLVFYIVFQFWGH